VCFLGFGLVPRYSFLSTWRRFALFDIYNITYKKKKKNLICWAIKNKFQKICYLTILYANLIRLRLFHSLLMVVVLKNVLILCIVPYEAFLLLFFMLDINIL
jgi:hypothetical protein